QRVAGGVDLGAGEVDLEAGDAGEGAGRGADLGGENGGRGDVVADQGRGGGEMGAGHLHAAARGSRAPDGGGPESLDLPVLSVGGVVQTGACGLSRGRTVLGTHETASSNMCGRTGEAPGWSR